MVMTKEPYVVNNLLMFTVLSYYVTVDSEGVIAWGWFTTATWWRWVEALWVDIQVTEWVKSIINSLMERKWGCAPELIIDMIQRF